MADGVVAFCGSGRLIIMQENIIVIMTQQNDF